MLAIGQLLDGRYRVIQPLGAGGFGHTYLAQDTKIPNYPTCVVKHLKPASNDPQVLDTAKRLFKTEAETLAVLGSHPQIPRLLAYFEEDSEFYLVQEYIPGHTLDREILPGQRWTEAQIISLLQEVLPVLQFVHDRGTIHRDIKPSNLIRRVAQPNLGVEVSGSLVLIDFGAIKQIQTQVAATAQSLSVAIGTPGYMPIEQLRGQPRPSSDIYALGIVCLQALSGRSPDELPENPNTGELAWQNLVAVSPGLAGILEKMTLNRLQYRYQTASDVIFDLQRLQQPQSPYPAPASREYVPTVPIPAPVPSPPPSNRSFLVPILVGGGAVAAIAAGFAVYPYMLQAFKSGNGDRVTPSPAPTAIGVISCTARVSGLNIRQQPSIKSAAIGSLNTGDSISIAGETNGTWLKIVAPIEGWVSKRDNDGRVLVYCPGDVEIRENPKPPAIRSSPRIRKTPRIKTPSSPAPSVKPTPKVTPTLSPTPTPTPSETVSPTPIPELTPTPEPTPTNEPTPIETPSAPVEIPPSEVPTPSESPIPIPVPTPETEIEGN